jgi:DNA-3-methyladenine glycosylase
MRLKRDFFQQNTIAVAKQLRGKFIVRKIGKQTLVGKIVETEAYRGFHDLASHAHKGKTARNAVMFDEGGYSYIYLVYGMYHCFNIITEKKDYPAAVLIRAVEPIEGLALMKKNRKTDELKNLCSGPAKFCQAFALTKKQSGIDLSKSKEIWLEDRGNKIKNSEIVKTKRVGIDYSGHCREWPWRFYLKDNKLISKK